VTITRWTAQEAIDRAEESTRYQEVVTEIIDRGFLGHEQTTEVFEVTSICDFD
jgi:hypothetical protein